MKRVGNLMSQVADYDNIQLAFIKSCRGKQAKREVIEFRNNYDENISNIRKLLLSGDIQVGNYNYFKIFDPKERLICAASFRERVIHHAIINVCHQYFERTLIYDTYATRIGKGVYKALDKAKIAASKYQYVAKLDYRKYFDSIDHEVLKEKLERLFKDKELLKLFYKIIDSYCVAEGKGVPIGNLTSQYFANYYLSSLDHKMKEDLRVPVYLRYMDDILMMDNDKSQLKNYVRILQGYSKQELKLQLKEPIYCNSQKGVQFLGYIVKSYRLLLNGRSKKRFREKINYYSDCFEKEIISEEEYQQHLLPLLAFASYANNNSFQRVTIEGVNRRLIPRESWW